VIKKIEEVQKQGIKISMIAPSHGIIWRSNPMKIVEAYLRWAKGESEKRILVVYDTMWGSTEKMARAIVDGISSTNVAAKVYRIPSSDRGDIIGDLLEAKGILVGSSTINNGILPTLAPLLEELKGLKPRGKIAAAFGSYGWAGGSTKVIEESLRQAGMEIASPSISVNWVPNKEEIQKCYEFGKSFAAKIA
jgi:flavorubredoxin